MRPYYIDPVSKEKIPLDTIHVKNAVEGKGRVYARDPETGSLSLLESVKVLPIEGDPEPTVQPLFRLDKTSVSGNTLTDTIGGKKATVTGTISASDTAIVNDGASWIFKFPISGAYTLRMILKCTKISGNSNCIGFGSDEAVFAQSIHVYANQNTVFSQSAQTIKIADATVGNSNLWKLQLCGAPFESHEIVLSMGEIQENQREIRIFCDGQLKQNGSLAHANYMPPEDFQSIGNSEGSGRFFGEYELIEVYSQYMDVYPEAFKR